MSLCISSSVCVSLGKEECSHQCEQERFNKNHLKSAIHILKRQRDLVAPCWGQSEPKGMWLLSGGSSDCTGSGLYSQSLWGEGTSVCCTPSLAVMKENPSILKGLAHVGYPEVPWSSPKTVEPPRANGEAKCCWQERVSSRPGKSSSEMAGGKEGRWRTPRSPRVRCTGSTHQNSKNLGWWVHDRPFPLLPALTQEGSESGNGGVNREKFSHTPCPLLAFYPKSWVRAGKKVSSSPLGSEFPLIIRISTKDRTFITEMTLFLCLELAGQLYHLRKAKKI